jgi:Transglycosylase SLT domain
MMRINSILQFLRKICRQPTYLVISLLLFSQQSAFADVWGYVDDKGVAHFSSERVDARYELFFRGGESFDTDTGVKQKPPLSGAATVDATAKLDPNLTAKNVAREAANSKIQAYFDVSPGYKSVRHLMRDASTTHRVDMELLQALIIAESGFDPLAVSPKGAVGLMQLMPETAKRFGVHADRNKTVEQKLRDPKTNISAGTKYLRKLINMFPGKLELAIASYNAGEGAVQKYGNKIPPYKETENYVKTVMQTYQALKPPPVMAEIRKITAQNPVTTSVSAPTTASSPTRIIMQMGGGTLGSAPVGGAVGRGNMIAPLAPVATADSTTVQN